MSHKHYNFSVEDELPTQQVKGKVRPPSRRTIRLRAKASSEGGRGCCHFCREYFSMTYLQMKKVALFREELVCKDCVKDKGL